MSANAPNDVATDLFRSASATIELRAAADGSDSLGTMEGHFAVFNQWTEINSIFEGRFMERIAPGAMTKTMDENRANMRVLFQHGFDPQIDDKPLGTIKTLEEDDEGARYAVELFDTSYNRDLVPAIRAGQYGASFRFSVITEDWARKPDASPDNPKGLDERTLREVKVREFGPVTWPAYPAATAGMRGNRSLTDHFAGLDPHEVIRRWDGIEASIATLLERTERIAPAPPGRAARSRTTDGPDRLPGTTRRSRLSTRKKGRYLP